MANDDPISKLQRRIADLDRQNANLSEQLAKLGNGHEELDPGKPGDLPLDASSQKGLKWRLKTQKRIRSFFASGATYDWVLWRIKRSLGLTTFTARQIIEDALEEEPEKEPAGRPRPPGAESRTDGEKKQ